MKAILVLDGMPESCIECCCHSENLCNVTLHYTTTNECINRPVWCPIIEISGEPGSPHEEKSSKNITTDIEAYVRDINLFRSWINSLQHVRGINLLRGENK